MLSPEEQEQLRRSAAMAGVRLEFADLGPVCSPGLIDARAERPVAIIDNKLTSDQAAAAVNRAITRSGSLRRAS